MEAVFCKTVLLFYLCVYGVITFIDSLSAALYRAICMNLDLNRKKENLSTIASISDWKKIDNKNWHWHS